MQNNKLNYYQNKKYDRLVHRIKALKTERERRNSQTVINNNSQININVGYENKSVYQQEYCQ